MRWCCKTSYSPWESCIHPESHPPWHGGAQKREPHNWASELPWGWHHSRAEWPYHQGKGFAHLTMFHWIKLRISLWQLFVLPNLSVNSLKHLSCTSGFRAMYIKSQERVLPTVSPPASKKSMQMPMRSSLAKPEAVVCISFRYESTKSWIEMKCLRRYFKGEEKHIGQVPGPNMDNRHPSEETRQAQTIQI